MLEPQAQAAADAALMGGMFGAEPAAPSVPVVPAQQTVQPAARPAVTQSEGDAPLPGHTSFQPSNRSHVSEPIYIPAPATVTPPQQVVQPQVVQPQTVQPQQQQLLLPGFPQLPLPPQHQTAQPAQVTLPVIPGGLPGQPQVATDPAQQPQQPHMVPVTVMVEERRRAQEATNTLREAQALNAQLVQLLQGMTAPQQQAQQEPIIDPDVDLPGYLAQQQRHTQELIRQETQRIRQEVQQQNADRISAVLNESQARAEAKYGPQVVAEAYQAVKQMGVGKQFINKPDAYEDMVQWHHNQKTIQAMGANPAAWAAQMAAQMRAQILAELRGNAAVPTNIPPSLTGSTSAASSHTVVPPTNDFFNHMFTRPAPAQHPARVA